ncbi:MAG: hypothetical protein C4547_06010 [Phycisphaerales bacterium]|nr:MAG: hypothetical protein C4547_06010 [Phycisphaerales bacterium]
MTIVKKPVDIPELALVLRALVGAAESWQQTRSANKDCTTGSAARFTRDAVPRGSPGGADKLRVVRLYHRARSRAGSEPRAPACRQAGQRGRR